MEYTCTPIEGIIASVTVETRAGFFSPVITVTAAKTPGFRIDNVDGLYLHTDCGNNFPVNERSENTCRLNASVCRNSRFCLTPPGSCEYKNSRLVVEEGVVGS